MLLGGDSVSKYSNFIVSQIVPLSSKLIFDYDSVGPITKRTRSNPNIVIPCWAVYNFRYGPSTLEGTNACKYSWNLLSTI